MPLATGDNLDPPHLIPTTEYGLPSPVLYGATVNNASSTAYADLPAGSSFSFTKRRSDTRVRLDARLLCFASVSSTGALVGLQISGTTYDVARGYFTAVAYQPVTGWTYVSGIPAGVYTVTGRWRTSAGTGALTIGSGISDFMATAREVW